MALWRVMYIPKRRQNTMSITAEIPTNVTVSCAAGWGEVCSVWFLWYKMDSDSKSFDCKQHLADVERLARKPASQPASSLFTRL